LMSAGINFQSEMNQDSFFPSGPTIFRSTYSHTLKLHIWFRKLLLKCYFCWKNSLIMNNPDLMLRKSILTKNDAITQHKWTSHILRNYSLFLRSELTNASKKYLQIHQAVACDAAQKPDYRPVQECCGSGFGDPASSKPGARRDRRSTKRSS
jgi:hypothetical protein